MDKDIVKKIRKSNNLTQRAFADCLDCSYSLIALVEVGKRKVSRKLELKINKVFPELMERER